MGLTDPSIERAIASFFARSREHDQVTVRSSSKRSLLEAMTICEYRARLKKKKTFFFILGGLHACVRFESFRYAAQRTERLKYFETAR